MTARSCTLTAGQSEVKVSHTHTTYYCIYFTPLQIDFPLPIVASNLVIEFRDFYDNLQVRITLTVVLFVPCCYADYLRGLRIPH